MNMLYEVDRCRGYENPHVYVESPAEVFETPIGTYIVEDVIKGNEWEFDTLEEAEAFAAEVEKWYTEDYNGR